MDGALPEALKTGLNSGVEGTDGQWLHLLVKGGLDETKLQCLDGIFVFPGEVGEELKDPHA